MRRRTCDMQLFPGGCFDWETGTLKENAKFPTWKYIEMNLKAQKISDKELIDLFDITPTALRQWKTGEREISKDKLIVLCNMFGVTIDQMLERDFSDDYMMEDFYGLSKFNDKADPKGFTESDFYDLFESLNRATFEIEYFALGYIPLEPDEDPNSPDEAYIGCGEVEYYCRSLDIDVTYDLSDGEKASAKSINYSELCKIADLLTSLWGNESYKHIIATPNQKYDIMLLKSENAKALINHLKEYKNVTQVLFKLWQTLKDENPSYDKDYIMAKVLLSDGAYFTKDNKQDMEATLHLFRHIASIDAKKL